MIYINVYTDNYSFILCFSPYIDLKNFIFNIMRVDEYYQKKVDCFHAARVLPTPGKYTYNLYRSTSDSTSK
jgi:hypothetical protein